MSDCIFCKIINGELPSEKVYESETVLGFKDISPSAEVHILFIHKNHSQNLNQMMGENSNDVMEVLRAITQYTAEEGLVERGYRVVTNIGPSVGQTVFHTHFHVLAGEGISRLC
jgi:histidine triad (HIT) family protein